MTAKWKNLNAREEINKFTDDINKIGAGYNFGKDFVMKGAMYLTENLPIQYKLSSFTQKNLELIEDHWEDTKKAISEIMELQIKTLLLDYRYYQLLNIYEIRIVPHIFLHQA